MEKQLSPDEIITIQKQIYSMREKGSQYENLHYVKEARALYAASWELNQTLPKKHRIL